MIEEDEEPNASYELDIAALMMSELVGVLIVKLLMDDWCLAFGASNLVRSGECLDLQCLSA